MRKHWKELRQDCVRPVSVPTDDKTGFIVSKHKDVERKKCLMYSCFLRSLKSSRIAVNTGRGWRQNEKQTLYLTKE